MPVNLVRGEAVHPDLKGYAFDSQTAAEVGAVISSSKEGCISPWYSMILFNAFDTCYKAEDARKQMVDVLKYVDSRLPQMPKTSAGLQIFNPYTPKVVDSNLVNARIQMEIEGPDNEDDLHGNRPYVIQQMKKHFVDVMLSQMKRSGGIIYEAFTKSATLYCNFQ